MFRSFTRLAGLTLLFSWLSLAQAATDCRPSAQTQIPQAECEALVDLYNSTAGANWKNHTDWNVTNTPCSWFGVACNGRHVARLYLSGNQLHGSIPDSLGDLSNLMYLYLGNNQLSGSIPNSLGGLSNLVRIFLSINQLSGSIPESLGGLSNLTRLELGSNQLSGSIPEALGELSHLERLYLYDNQLTGSIPEFLIRLSHLEYIFVSRNQLSGSIPEFLSELSNLTYLNLSNNQLSGSIPESLGELSNLTSLYLNNNQLSGSIPDSLGNLSSLMQFTLFDNQLTGSIPDSLGDLSHLESLFLNNNQLTGFIPDSLGDLSHLKSLVLNNNHLCGDIPLSLMDLGSLTYLRLENNHLIASEPTLIEWLNSKQPNWEDIQTINPEYCEVNLVSLDSFGASLNQNNVTLTWTTGTEQDNAGFCLWRSAVDDNGEYVNVTALEELDSYKGFCVEGQLTAVDEPKRLIIATGNSREGACYSFEDTSINEDGTYVYVLEDVNTSGKRTFHCNDMDTITVGQGPTIDLEMAKRFCQQATGSVE